MKIRFVTAIPGDSRFSSIRHVVVGAAYGLLMGTAFVLMWAFIDSWLYPDLPLGVDWSLTAQRIALIGLALALIGAMTCLFNLRWIGLGAGGLTTSLLALATALSISSIAAELTVVVILFLLVPFAIMSLPIAWTIRILAEKHGRALNLGLPVLRIIPLVLIAAALGAATGYVMRMPEPAVVALRLMHDNLQTTPDSRDKEINELPQLQEHAGVSYELFEEASTESTEGFDIRAEYTDGYTVQCLVVVYPGATPYISDCEEIER